MFTKVLDKSRILFKYFKFPAFKINSKYLSNVPCKILGIETSCDDTGCAIVDNKGLILGEELISQQKIHTKYGGIIPPIARDFHEENIKVVVDNALKEANMDVSGVDAIAVTVKPGMALSLLVGMNYAKALSVKAKKPIIPIHHMEAHALTARMLEKIQFPFLVLLVSGGHCYISLVQDVDKILTLGKNIDDAPGEAFDKTFRRLKLINLDEMEGLGGGEAIEKAASCGDPSRFPIAEPLLQYKDCNFSFAGIKNSVRRTIIDEELKYGIEGDEIIPTVNDLCASFQLAIVKHLCRRLQRAMEFIQLKRLIPGSPNVLVVSGGVASNQFIRRALKNLCLKKEYELVIPPAKLCTDNGVMIAWNGVERYEAGKGIYSHEEHNLIDIEHRCPFGEDISSQVTEANIKCNWLRHRDLFPPPENLAI